MRIGDKSTGNKRSFKVRNDPAGNSLKYNEIKEILKLMEMEEHERVIWKSLAAILILGEVKFTEGNNGEAEVDSVDTAEIGIQAFLFIDSFIYSIVYLFINLFDYLFIYLFCFNLFIATRKRSLEN